MRPCCLIVGLCTLLAGCVTPTAREAAAEARGYARGYRQAVKEQYWLIQNQQRRLTPSAAPHPIIP